MTPSSAFHDKTGGANLKIGEKKMERRMDSDCGEGTHRGFRHLLPFLAIPMVFFVMRGIARHSYAYMGAQHREEWKNGVPPVFAELHRRAHAAEAEKPVETQA
jgi:hypothetical protein